MVPELNRAKGAECALGVVFEWTKPIPLDIAEDIRACQLLRSKQEPTDTLLVPAIALDQGPAVRGSGVSIAYDHRVTTASAHRFLLITFLPSDSAAYLDRILTRPSRRIVPLTCCCLVSIGSCQLTCD